MSNTPSVPAASSPIRPQPISPPASKWIVDFLLLAAIWGASFMFMRMASMEFGALPTATVRVSIASVFLLPLLIYKGHAALLFQHRQQLFVVGMLNSGIPFACYAFALLSITTGLSSILNATTPLFGALIAWWWLKDKPNTSRIVGLIVGFTGVALLAWNKASFKADAAGVAPGWAVLACLLATSCYGMAASYTRRFLTGVPPLVTAAGSQLGAAAGLAIPSLFFLPTHLPSAKAWGAILIVSVFCTALAYILYFRLIEAAGPAKALAVTFAIPVFAVFFGVLMGEAVTMDMVLGGVVIVCGTALSTGLLHWGASKKIPQDDAGAAR